MSKNMARTIFTDALDAVLPKNVISLSCRVENDILIVADEEYDLKKYKNLYVFGSGKAAYTMAKEMETILGERLYKGLVVSPYDNGELRKIEVKIGSHPLPTQKSIDASKDLVEMMQECNADDLYIYLLSGGTSALLEISMESITLEDLQKTTSLMLSNSFKIEEINSVRKQLSTLKGGKLANFCKAEGLVLVISDVISNDLNSIGSAPLYFEKDSTLDAKSILQEKNILSQMPLSVQKVLTQKVIRTALKKVKHIIISSNKHALDAAQKSALSYGLSVKKVEQSFEDEVNLTISNMLDLILKTDEQCILLGGEYTVNMSGSGQGGRNQHAALLMLKKIHDNNLNITFLSAGTDGIDGNSDAAGAVVDKKSYSDLDIDAYLKNFDSYNYFNKTQSIIKTGPSGTNVADLVIIIKG